MLISVQEYLRRKKLIPATRYLRTDTFATGNTQERRRPAREDALEVQKRFTRTMQ